jgi:hypothetical protein
VSKKRPDIRRGKSVREALGLPPALKYHNQPVEVDGQRFDSKKEANRWAELRLMEKAGLIRALRRQVKFPLTVNGHLVCTYIADFVYEDVEKGREIVEDAKGVRTPAYRIKRELILALRGIKIHEV